uniref:Uncharacterized protein n=1 Tax=Timema poppense TaxID=170557 RepID=A0A7R9HBY4_TIMPO|nr:unnamed protein product [Timema poppensis]
MIQHNFMALTSSPNTSMLANIPNKLGKLQRPDQESVSGVQSGALISLLDTDPPTLSMAPNTKQGVILSPKLSDLDISPARSIGHTVIDLEEEAYAEVEAKKEEDEGEVQVVTFSLKFDSGRGLSSETGLTGTGPLVPKMFVPQINLSIGTIQTARQAIKKIFGMLGASSGRHDLDQLLDKLKYRSTK